MSNICAKCGKPFVSDNQGICQCMTNEKYEDFKDFKDYLNQPHKLEFNRRVQVGWLCPACGAGNSPFSTRCSCKDVPGTWSGFGLWQGIATNSSVHVDNPIKDPKIMIQERQEKITKLLTGGDKNHRLSVVLQREPHPDQIRLQVHYKVDYDAPEKIYESYYILDLPDLNVDLITALDRVEEGLHQNMVTEWISKLRKK